MPSSCFHDADGREWRIRLDAPILRTIREELELDLLDLEGQTFERLQDDILLLVDTLWVICRDQAQAVQMTARQFGEALVGDAIGDATVALTQALENFFPPRKRLLLQRLSATYETVRQKTETLVLAKLDDPALLELIETKIQRDLTAMLEKALTPSPSATISPGSSASTPED